jgi:hypothetical protein
MKDSAVMPRLLSITLLDDDPEKTPPVEHFPAKRNPICAKDHTEKDGRLNLLQHG